MKLFVQKTLLVTAVAGISMISGAALAGDDRTRLECRGEMALEDAGIQARYEEKGDRAKFSVELEAAAGGSFQDGDIFQVRVGGELVGTIALAQGAVDVVGELNFDTTAGPLDADSPFPANFPTISAGSIVEVGAQLACDLQSR